jgi:hypothetical protein
VRKVIEDQVAARFDLRSARPRIGQYVGIGMPGVTATGFETSARDVSASAALADFAPADASPDF